jgi:SagB-type dehydrogenase family enzyme
MIYGELASTCGALFVVSAMFWRSRFKYGLRGYRFTLLEAGHVVQNLQLAAAASGLGCLPIGGFFDRRLDDILALDGVNESALYCVAVGTVPEAA